MKKNFEQPATLGLIAELCKGQVSPRFAKITVNGFFDTLRGQQDMLCVFRNNHYQANTDYIVCAAWIVSETQKKFIASNLPHIVVHSPLEAMRILVENLTARESFLKDFLVLTSSTAKRLFAEQGVTLSEDSYVQLVRFHEHWAVSASRIFSQFGAWSVVDTEGKTRYLSVKGGKLIDRWDFRNHEIQPLCVNDGFMIGDLPLTLILETADKSEAVLEEALPAGKCYKYIFVPLAERGRKRRKTKNRSL